MSKELHLIELLAARTHADTLAWTTTAEEYEFTTTLANSTISVKRVNLDSEQGADIFFAILDEDGREVLSSLNGSGMEGVDYRILNDLYEVARRSAFKVDKTLDKIISSLEDDILF